MTKIASMMRCNAFISRRIAQRRDAADVTDRQAATYWSGAA